MTVALRLFSFVLVDFARWSLLRKYSYSGHRSNVDPLRNTPWKHSLVSARSRTTTRALPAVSVNYYMRTVRPASRSLYSIHRRRDGEEPSRLVFAKKDTPFARVYTPRARGESETTTAEKSTYGNRM